MGGGKERAPRVSTNPPFEEKYFPSFIYIYFSSLLDAMAASGKKYMGIKPSRSHPLSFCCLCENQALPVKAAQSLFALTEGQVSLCASFKKILEEDEEVVRMKIDISLPYLADQYGGVFCTPPVFTFP